MNKCDKCPVDWIIKGRCPLRHETVVIATDSFDCNIIRMVKMSGDKEKQNCNCEDWVNKKRIICAAMDLMHYHNFKSSYDIAFNYCPWCGKKLEIK